ncbi:MAG TPA: four helix bundle protein [Candidatus Saccharimonadales bacterium]|nr:four helix bundle protein [Candidatus Saccharimonadales bacterium]
MATIQNFKEIMAWQKAEELTLAVYKEFKDSRDFPFRDQIQRASVSIMNNIAEGFERKGNKEFIRFLFIAKGSCAEVRSMLSLAQKLTYLLEDRALELDSCCTEITKMLSVFIKKLDN